MFYKRHRRGQQLIEVSCGLIFLIPVFLFLFDIAFMYFATNLSDGVARDAARAAAAAEPTVPGPGRTALNASVNNFTRAQAIVTLARQRTTSNGYIRQFAIDTAANRSFVNVTQVPDPFRGGPWQGTVTVRTILTYALPVAIPGVTPPTIDCEAEAQFPLTSSRQGTVRNFVR